VVYEIHDAVAALPGSTAARKLIVANALRYLDGLSRDAGDDPSLQLELARGYLRLGDVQGFQAQANLGDSFGAIASYRRAYALLKTLHGSRPGDDQVTVELAAVCRHLGLVLSWVRQPEQARPLGAEAVSLLEGLVSRAPTDSNRQHLAAAYSSMGDMSGQDLSYRFKALPILEALLAARPEDPARRRDVALVHKNIASRLVPRAEGEKALPHLKRAQEVDESRVAAEPTNREAQMDLSFDYSQNATFHLNREQYPQALENFRKAIDIRRRLAEADPADARLQDRLVYGWSHVGEVLGLMDRPAEALAAYRDALQISRRLLAAQPQPQFRANVAVSQAGIARSEAALGHLELACAAWRAAADGYRGLDREGKLREYEVDEFHAALREASACAGAANGQ
jgi:tetratricopeptide (TPR) repeat protein